MSLISWNPFREVDSISRDMETFFERSPFGFFSRATAPRVDVFETEKDVVVKAEIPGVSKEDLNVYVDENSIRLSGETKRDTEYKNEHIYRTERYYGSFSRTIPLPVEVKSEQAKAEYKDGILTVTVPKVETTQMKGKKIDIH
ncbi:MAG TPA: Hsp20/alpha crystallin family protein [Hungateiclostridium thermocellum]|jgi:HSP20 family protein|uniref:Heat shock protein Hsp20 n=2 Tax=Acetivibrio thermocellus TaxID=1515 RepID=A3DBE9_ACET2|nr:Hsp20/alpha crystallin family protein [Acetivibrio thermocellus]CDG34719.1 heat shock protein Hsp20 [Acetivibrio thermocellus BC1]ABN51278.1 heat shock protein Hsp20 [Acetivibrio thermocellus ATCC 27405]ADU75237.1 heat shock protein Hsp20 [Acetivibrio thermocellus DSM 1313]ALX09212.1 heat shock protein Hsp20 [Acetivibrio thermocellus AD2]ANV76964.1 heat shock protein Hsp20 [Acetivibrio thermocellus DSM 2360]